MKLNVKAALLSAFVLPGLGQVVKGERVKGGILIALSNIFLLGAFFLILKGMGPVLLEAQLAGSVDANAVARKLAAGAPAARVLLACFAALWCFAVVDALVERRKER
ncbi:hypothetical protein [Geobacter sp.]|uniref:hypothetical protein n=1 Tax=Geobacter sp. TaxID=46610 RepID=UPI0027BA955C|nr:hypothetical protein [Geobacter sp.]